MRNFFLNFVAIIILFSCTSVLMFSPPGSQPIIGKWIWKESIHVDNKRYFSTPKSNGSIKEIVFTEDGKIITYKNGVEIRISKYVLSKGISVFDQKEHDLITFEGITYIVERVDSNNLVLANNSFDGYRSKFSK